MAAHNLMLVLVQLVVRIPLQMILVTVAEEMRDVLKE